MLPDHIRALHREREWLEEHRRMAEWQYFEEWPEWIPEDQRYPYENPGLTMNRLDIQIQRNREKTDKAFKLWMKLST